MTALDDANDPLDVLERRISEVLKEWDDWDGETHEYWGQDWRLSEVLCYEISRIAVMMSDGDGLLAALGGVQIGWKHHILMQRHTFQHAMFDDDGGYVGQVKIADCPDCWPVYAINPRVTS